MLKIQQPNYNNKTVIDLLLENMDRNVSIKGKLKDIQNFNNLNQIWNEYDKLAQNYQLFSISPYAGNSITTNIMNNLNYHEFIMMYERYLRKKGKRVRRIYDEILANSEKCPLCGHIGTSAQLDHYLPKSNYPQYSVYPKNLIPCCRDCNQGYKKTQFAKKEEEQLIHPYFDKDIFFDDQWIYAEYKSTSLCDREAIVVYYVQAPDTWSQIDKVRVQKHFNDLDLGIRFAKEANTYLQTLIPQLIKLKFTMSDRELLDFYKDIGCDFPINHWTRVMYGALREYIANLVKYKTS